MINPGDILRAIKAVRENAARIKKLEDEVFALQSEVSILKEVCPVDEEIFIDDFDLPLDYDKDGYGGGYY